MHLVQYSFPETLAIYVPDSLVYRTMNKPREEMETFEYSRWKEPEKMDLHGLQLEDAADEFHL